MPTHKTTKVAKKYPHELSQKQWKHLRKLLPRLNKKAGGPGRTPLELRQVINAILYIMRSGYSWSMLPNDYPHPKSVYPYFNQWSKDNTWEKMHLVLVKKVRKKAGRKKRPTASSVDSQSVKTTQVGGQARGLDGGKWVKGRKRFILVDTLGLLLAVKVVAANTAEKTSAQALQDLGHELAQRTLWPYRVSVGRWGYQGDELYDWVATLTGWLWQVVKRSNDKKGFVLLPRRWVVERSFAWLSFNRRLSKDYEKLTRNSESALYISMLPIMIHESISWYAYQNDFDRREGVRLKADGPTMQFHEHFYKEGKYDKHLLLSTARESDGDLAIDLLLTTIRCQYPERTMEPLFMDISDPIDLLLIKNKVETLLLRYRDCEIDIFFSPGTSAMQLSWYICHTSLGLRTRLLQTNPGFRPKRSRNYSK